MHGRKCAVLVRGIDVDDDFVGRRAHDALWRKLLRRREQGAAAEGE
jgi:hypothetical protein